MVSNLDYRIEERLNSHTLGGIVLLIIGVLGMGFPWLFSRAVIYLVGFVLVSAGLIFGFLYFTTLGESKVLITKSLILLFLGLISLLSPVLGLKILTAIAALFFLSAAITNFMLARSIRSQKGESAAILVGILCLMLDLWIVVGWQETSQFFIGLFLGLVLFVDGILFLVIGLKIRRGNWSI